MADQKQYLIRVLKRKKNETSDEEFKKEIDHMIQYLESTTDLIHTPVDLHQCVNRSTQRTLEYFGRAVYLAVCLLRGDINVYNVVRAKLGLNPVQHKKKSANNVTNNNKSKNNKKPWKKNYTSRKTTNPKLGLAAPEKSKILKFTDLESKAYSIFIIKSGYDKLEYINSAGKTISSSPNALKKHINLCDVEEALVKSTMSKFSRPFKILSVSFYIIKYIAPNKELIVSRENIKKYGPIFYATSWQMKKVVINETHSWLLLSYKDEGNTSLLIMNKPFYNFLDQKWIKYKHNNVHKKIKNEIDEITNKDTTNVIGAKPDNTCSIDDQLKNDMDSNTHFMELDELSENVENIEKNDENNQIEFMDIKLEENTEQDILSQFKTALMITKIKNIDNENITLILEIAVNLDETSLLNEYKQCLILKSNVGINVTEEMITKMLLNKARAIVKINKVDIADNNFDIADNNLAEISNSSKQQAYITNNNRDRDKEKIFHSILVSINLKEIEISGDNNCQFASFGLIIYGNTIYHDLIRQTAVDLISMHPNFFKHFICGQSIEDYCNIMRLTGETWGDNATMSAIMTIYETNVDIYIHNFEPHILLTNPKYSRKSRVAYRGNKHWNAIVEVNNFKPILTFEDIGTYERQKLIDLKEHVDLKMNNNLLSFSRKLKMTEQQRIAKAIENSKRNIKAKSV